MEGGKTGRMGELFPPPKWLRRTRSWAGKRKFGKKRLRQRPGCEDTGDFRAKIICGDHGCSACGTKVFLSDFSCGIFSLKCVSRLVHRGAMISRKMTFQQFRQLCQFPHGWGMFGSGRQMVSKEDTGTTDLTSEIFSGNSDRKTGTDLLRMSSPYGLMLRFLQTLLARRQEDANTRRKEPRPAAIVARGAPKKLHLETGMFPVMNGVRYSVSRGTITRVHHGERRSACRRKPEAEEWRDFWSVVERLRVDRWQSYYQNSRHLGGIRLDGTGWRFQLRDGSLRVRSSGRGRYPSSIRPHLSTNWPEALDMLKAELARLVNSTSAVERPTESETSPDPSPLVRFVSMDHDPRATPGEPMG